MKQILVDLNQDLVTVRSSKIHGNGVYANKNISKGTYLLEYLGERISKQEGDRREKEQREKAKLTGEGSDYIFYLNDKIDIDGNFDYNIARLINHTCEPNCEFEIIDDKVYVRAIKDIEVGVELSINYGYDDLDNFHLHPCKCGKPNCIGFIIGEDHKERFLEMIKNK